MWDIYFKLRNMPGRAAVTVRVASAMVDKQTGEQGDKRHIMLPRKDVGRFLSMEN